MPKKKIITIIIIFFILWGVAYFLRYRFDLGDRLSPREVKKYIYASFNDHPHGNFLAKIDTEQDKILAKYPIASYFHPTTIDFYGNVYLRESLPGDKVLAFYPQRKSFRKLVKAKGAIILNAFRYKNNFYVITYEQARKDPPIQSGLDIYNLRTKKYLKTIYFNDFGTTSYNSYSIDYQKGLLYVFTNNMNSFRYSNDEDRSFLHIIDLNQNKRILNKDLSQYTMGPGNITLSNEKIYFTSKYLKFTKKELKNHYIERILSYSPKDKKTIEKIRLKNKNEIIEIIYFDKETKKLYTEISNRKEKNGFCGIRIIDTHNWKTIKEIPFWSIYDIVKVNQNKIYIDALKKEKDIKSIGIYVLNTKTDTITKFIEGNFFGITRNPWHH